MSTKIINVPNGNNTPTTTAEILIENKIDYTPKVSVIIPVYNVEKYLRQCLDSLINQTLKDIEIICVDDGSLDNSLNILRDYEKKDNRIKVFTQKNQGAGAARNFGMLHATGKYLSLLDSDDYFECNMLELLYDKVERTKADIVICRSQSFDEQTKSIKAMPWTLKTAYFSQKDVFNYKDVVDHVFDFCIGWSWDKLYNTKFVKETKLQFQNLRSTDDAFFVFMSLLHANKMTFIEDVLVTHRKNTYSSISETLDKNPECFLEAVFAMQKYMKEKGVYNEVKQSFLNWVCLFCFWHLDTLHLKENKEKLKNRLEKDVFKDFEIYKLKKNFFYDKKLYNRIHSKNFESNLSFYQKIFSVKKSFNKKYKIIHLFGLEIRIKRKRKYHI